MAHNEIDAALQRFTAPQSDPVALLRGLMDAIRPADRRDGPTATANWRALNSAMASNETYRQAVGAKFLELLATRRLMSFFAEEGILPATGFVAELNRKIIHKILPELQDEKVFKDCLVLVFHRRKDYLWFNAIPIEDKLTFWRSLDWNQAANGAQVGVVYEQLLEALLIVSHSTLALAFHPELRRVCPEVEERPSPFLALHQEVSRFVDQCRARITRQEFRSHESGDRKQDAGTNDQEPANSRSAPSTLTPDHCSPTPVHAFTGAQSKAAGIPKALMLCRLQLSHALAATLERGVRLSLTYLLTRLEQHLDRVSLLYDMLGAPSREQLSPQCIADIDGFLRNTVIGETQRNSVRRHFSDLMGLLALRITENASRTGEHYITSDWRGYRTLWWSAMGAGFIVAFLALFKILSSDWPLTALGSGVVASMNYGLGFVIISLLHFTLATKQPAMTAATIADAIHVSEGEVRQDEGLVSLIVDTLRSQFAAILGNVFLALVTATIIAWWYAGYYGRPLVDEYYANKMLEQFDPLKGTLFYAAIAGVWLFVSGLVTGYFDNLATYARLGKRIGCLGWLTVVVGRARAQRIGAYVDRHFGVIVGNFLFGWMLGMTGALGVMLGLPLDVRHVTFSAATLGYGLAGLDYQVSAGTVLQASLGVALIGLVNLTVSFTLALYVALRSRGATFASIPSLVVHTARRVIKNPLRLLMPPRGAVAKH